MPNLTIAQKIAPFCMISIITAIHNGLAFNKIFFESLHQYTKSPFELIVIDNDSTDGSREYFKEKGAVVVENKDNFSYPFCQNQGIKIAQGEILAFLNNDLYLGPQWDEILIQAMKKHGIDVISASGIENQGNKRESQQIQRKWKRVKNFTKIFGFGERNMRRMHRLMYGDWHRFCTSKFQKHGLSVVEGIVGNNVIMSRSALEKVGEWDERIQAADFDLFMRVKKRSEEYGDLKPCQIALGAYIHHYIRMTSKYAVKYKPFADRDRLITLSDKWSDEDQIRLHPDAVTSKL